MIPLLRVVKLLAVGALLTGTIGAILPRDLRDRRLFAYALAGPAFGVAWLAGFTLAGLEELSVLSTWAIGAMVCSFFSLQVVLYAVGREGRRGPWVAVLALVPLVATVALMVYRPA